MAILTVETKSEEQSLFDILISQAKGKAPKKKVEEEEDDADLDDEAPKKSAKKSKSDDDDDDDDAEEGDDDWNKEEEDDAWDPDFEEFDLPKSKGKKAPGVGKKPAEEEEDFKVEDDEFKDLFNDGAVDDDEEEDF